MNNNQTFGRFVRQFRKIRHLTLDHLSNRTGISKSNLSKIENGKGNPSLETITRLALALNVTFHIGPS